MDHSGIQLAPWLNAAGPPRAAVEWMEPVEVACESGLAGLLLEHVSRHGLEPPADAAETLRRAAASVAQNNIHLHDELADVVQAFNRAKVPVMLLKGAALNHTIYPRYNLRPMSDLDLLVHPDSAEEAVQLLADHGCPRGFDLVRDDFFPKYHNEVELLTGSPNPARIDLHARPLRPLRISQTMPDDALWEDAQPVHIGDGKAWIPRPELNCLHLAAHAAYHGCSRLIWLYDLLRLHEAYGSVMDWGLLVDRAREWKLSWPVLFALRRAGELLGEVCPPGVIEKLEGHPIGWRDRLALVHAPRDAAAPISHLVVDLLCTPGIRFRIGYASSFVLPGGKHLAGIYPFRHRGWKAVAHLWRCLRAAGRAVAGLASAPAALLRRGSFRLASP